MKTFTSQDLQRNTGDIQLAAAVAPVVITTHGKPRNIMMSLDEFRRLKAAAGEKVPHPLLSKPAQVRRPIVDPLGYDVSNFFAAALQMAADEKDGRGEDAVQRELATVKRLFPRSAS